MGIPKKPKKLRIVVFVDGQNFYKDCEDFFGHGATHPHLLGQEICHERFGPDRILQEVRYYTGIHAPRRDPAMNSYLQKRLSVMEKNGVTTFSRPLKYRDEYVEDKYNPGKIIKIPKGREKGVDVRIALDMVMVAIDGKYDIAALVSRDTDLNEAINDIYEIRENASRWMVVENVVCFPNIDPDTGVRPPLKRLRLAQRPIHIDQEIFNRIRDNTNYWK